MNRGLSKYVRGLEAQGYTVVVTNGSHLRITHPNMDGPVFAGVTPSCHRADKNLRAILKRKTRPDEVQP